MDRVYRATGLQDLGYMGHAQLRCLPNRDRVNLHGILSWRFILMRSFVIAYCHVDFPGSGLPCFCQWSNDITYLGLPSRVQLHPLPMNFQIMLTI